MGKKCDLCNGVARMYCESDQASLCWNCDALVHGANFLVAKHTRCLLCTTCHSLTPWTASGLRLRPTFSVCHSCVALKNVGVAGENRIQEEVNSSESEEDRVVEDGAESYDEDEEYSGNDDEEEEEEAENQVVPWSTAAQPSPVMSSSCSDGVRENLVTKRTRDCSDDEIGSSSTQESNYSRPLKRTLRKETAV